MVPLVVLMVPLVVPMVPLVVPDVLPLVLPLVAPDVVWAKAALLRPNVRRVAIRILVVFIAKVLKMWKEKKV